MDRKPKIVWQLDSPFTKFEWPEVSAEHQNTILELLCSLISPIGKYRLNHATHSKGKRSNKRKRKIESANRMEITNSKALVPPVPEISAYVMTGLNSIIRCLQSLSSLARKKIVHDHDLNRFTDDVNTTTENFNPSNRHFVAIILLSSSQPAILLEHLPQLVATASLAHPELPETRLLQVPKGSRTQLCESLGLPRVSIIGILEGAPLSIGLIEFIRQHIPEAKASWLQEARSCLYLPVTVNSIETSAPVSEKSRKEK